MPTIVYHGGGCCGVLHIRGFGAGHWPPAYEPTTAESLTAMLRPYDLKLGPKQKGKVIEAVITDQQFKNQPNLAQIMADQGFKIVTRFFNNTGGMCNILHRVSGGRDIKKAAVKATFLNPLL